MTGAPRPAGNKKPAQHRDLALRASSALVLAASAIVLTYAGLWPFVALVAAGSTIVAWEWNRLVRDEALGVAFYAHVVAVIAACALVAQGTISLAFLVLATGAFASAIFTALPGGRRWSAFGVLYLGVSGLLLVLFRTDPIYGISAIFFLFLIVWSADTAAYFSGRVIGGPKLAPVISPGKTWAGFTGGLVVPTLLSFAFALWLGGTSAMILALIGAVLALACQCGDLAESAIKRTFDFKDSGHILPGHGGLFDRVDGLIGAVLAAGIIACCRDLLNPGKALLIWP